MKLFTITSALFLCLAVGCSVLAQVEELGHAGANLEQLHHVGRHLLEDNNEAAIELSSGTFPFADIEVYYQMYDTDRPDAPVVLFLHGMKFTSDIWVRLGTLKLLRQKGFRTIAIDLPGYGRTRALPYADNNMRAEVVKAALEFAQKGHNITAVLMSPSMSGKYAVPFLDRYGLMLAGWVALAPVGVTHWGGPWEYTHKKVGLLAIYGETDPMASDADVVTKLFAQSKKVILKSAGHACYVDQTKAFHSVLLPWLRSLKPDIMTDGKELEGVEDQEL